MYPSSADRPIIALDADGVLLNYNEAWGAVWRRHFEEPERSPAEPRAYHAHTYWGLDLPERSHPFWEAFTAHGWSTMPAMPGAVEACQRLAAAGYELVCVTSIPAEHQAARCANLQALGFPIQRVIATGSCQGSSANPKKAAIEALRPSWFVDDELRKLKDLEGISLVLIDPGHPDTPNPPELSRDHLTLVVPHLMAFAEAVLGPWSGDEETRTVSTPLNPVAQP